MIREKLKGHKPIIAAAPERGNVINLMDALKASLGAGQAAGAEQGQGRAEAEKPAAKPRAKAAAAAGQGAGQAEGSDGGRRQRPSASSARSRPFRGGWRRARSSASGGQLRRGVTRRTTHLVFGRALLDKRSDAAIEARVDAELRPAGELLSENGFLRLLGAGRDRPERSALTRQSLLDQSRLRRRDFDLLALFDAFEHDAEPFSFRDLILARKYAGLIAGGAGWGAIARSVHRSGPVASLTAMSLHVEGRDAIYARDGEGLSELDGQLLLDLGRRTTTSRGAVRARRERRGARGASPRPRRSTGAASRSIPRDSVAAFNRANCLRAMAAPNDAAHDYAGAIKLDPGFVEAWFNFAGLLASAAGSRRRAAPDKAIALDPGYADAGLQPRDARVRGRRSRRGAALVGALSRTRPRLGMGAHRDPRHPVRRHAVDAEDGRVAVQFQHPHP